MDKLKKAAVKLATAQSRVAVLEQIMLMEMIAECHGAGGQRAMAKRLGISDTFISDIVRGRRPISAVLVKKIMEA